MNQSIEISLGYSPCPNDTFIFYALNHGKIPLEDFRVRERLEDVETLNRLALEGVLDMTKISYHALGHLRDRYALLRSGSALGRGCGPLVVAATPGAMEELRGKRIAIPGRLTTAALLLRLQEEIFEELVEMPFHRIMDAVVEGSVDAGVIIHESRFTYEERGLHLRRDLGRWWERETGLPLPLGGILVRRDLGSGLIARLDSALRRSLEYALAHPQEPRDYIRRHAQELSDEVTQSHIRLYVNDYSLELGAEGERAVRELLGRAEHLGIIPACELPLLPS